MRSTMHNRGLLIPALLFAATPAVAQVTAAKHSVPTIGRPSTVPLGQRIMIRSKLLGEDREILVHLPAHYGETQRRFPVLIVLDGNLHFEPAATVVDFLSRDGRMPEMIVVGVSTLQRRNRDLTLPMLHDIERRPEYAMDHPGGAEKFLGFVADELAPWIDAHYRTEPYRVLSGHSFGGLFSVLALLERPDVFQANIAASAALWWDKEEAAKRVRAGIGRITTPHFLFMTWSDSEPLIRNTDEALAEWLKANPPPMVRWETRYYPGGDHGTTALPTLFDGLSALFDGWSPEIDIHKIRSMDYPTVVAAHQAARSARFGYSIAPQWPEMDALAEWFLDKGRPEDALATARGNRDRFPELQKSYMREAEALRALKRYREALAVYRTGMKYPNEYGSIYEDAKNVAELQALIVSSRKARGGGAAR